MMLTIPLAGGGQITIDGPFKLAEQDWNQFMAVLQAMKPGLVRTPGKEG